MEENKYIVVDVDGKRTEFDDEERAKEYAMDLSRECGEKITLLREPEPYHSFVDVCCLEAWMKKRGMKF